MRSCCSAEKDIIKMALTNRRAFKYFVKISSLLLLLLLLLFLYFHLVIIIQKRFNLKPYEIKKAWFL